MVVTSSPHRVTSGERPKEPKKKNVPDLVGHWEAVCDVYGAPFTFLRFIRVREPKPAGIRVRQGLGFRVKWFIRVWDGGSGAMREAFCLSATLAYPFSFRLRGVWGLGFKAGVVRGFQCAEYPCHTGLEPRAQNYSRDKRRCRGGQ